MLAAQKAAGRWIHSDQRRRCRRACSVAGLLQQGPVELVALPRAFSSDNATNHISVDQKRCRGDIPHFQRLDHRFNTDQRVIVTNVNTVVLEVE